MSRAPSAPWHALSPEACLQELKASPEGLSTADAARRLADTGANKLQLSAGRSTLEILWDQFSNVMLIMLLAVAAVSGAVSLHQQEFPKDALAILVIVVLNGLLGYLQESKAQQALLALRDMAQPLVVVRRDGDWQRLSSELLVPGDLIRLEAGDKIPADARLLEAADLGVREAALTGEAEAVFKQPGLLLEENTPVLERQNCLFQGTEVVRGRGVALVSATGMATELGQIAELINTAGGESTPLQERLDGLAKVLVGSALALVAVVVGLGLLLGQDPLNLLEVSLSMAVAIVPEGLPAVITVTLAIGTQRMVRRAALIRRLPAVEGLGSVTVICSDKTGTLTQNRQVVQELRLGTEAIAVGGQGYEPTGDLTPSLLPPPEGATAGCVAGARELLLQAGVLCSDAEHKQKDDGSWDVLGDPTEGALSVVAAKAGIDDFQLRSHFQRAAEIPFSSERQLMAVWVDDPNGTLQAPLGESARGSNRLLISKGAPEVIIGQCARWIDGAGVVALSEPQRQWWLEQARQLAGSGLRVLAFACAPHHASPDQELQGQVLLGLMAQLDPARPEVATAVATCRKAGIRPVMITGDHPLTARAIGSAIGLTSSDGEVILGRELEAMEEPALREAVARCSVYARVAPEQKLRIVKALQANGQVVAMTGDGVNDAPALKAAHIGIAMGRRGTDVAREAASLVLMEDDFGAIVKGLRMGRRILDNVRKGMVFVLAVHVPIAGLALMPLLAGWPPLFAPVHIAFLELVIDPVCAIVFEAEDDEDDVMARPPRDPAAPAVSGALVRLGLWQGAAALGAVGALYVGLWQAGVDSAQVRAAVFTALVTAVGALVLANRSFSAGLWAHLNRPNRALWAVLGGTSLLLLCALEVPALQAVFSFAALAPLQAVLAVGVGLALLPLLGLLARRQPVLRA